MAGIAPRKNAAEYVKLVGSLAPVAGTGSAQNGAAVDRLGYVGAVGILLWTTSGGVTGGTIAVKMQDSADGSTGWADYGTAVSVSIPAGPNATGAAEVGVDITGAKRYVRMVVDSDPTGGTPASIVGAAVLLTGPDQLPAA